jgi:hypothetical protein
MSEIQRFQWTELTKDGIGLPDDVVLYTDHAAEVSRLEAEVVEQCRLNAMGAEGPYGRDCEEAIAAWNTRTPKSPAPSAEVK